VGNDAVAAVLQGRRRAAQAEWKRASAGLKRHEQHHVDLAKQPMKGLHKKLAG